MHAGTYFQICISVMFHYIIGLLMDLMSMILYVKETNLMI